MNNKLPDISNNKIDDSILSKVSSLNDFYFIVHIILSKLNKDNKYGLVAELSYLLDSNSFTNLITYFEGETITIPTKEDVTSTLKLLELYYNYKVLGKSWDTSLADTYGDNIDSEYKKLISVTYLELDSYLKDIKLPNVPGGEGK